MVGSRSVVCRQSIRWQSSGKTLAGLGPGIIFTTVNCTPHYSSCTSKPYNILNLKSQTVVTLTALYTTLLSMYWGTLLYCKYQITNCCNPRCTVHNTTLHVLGDLMIFQISNKKTVVTHHALYTTLLYMYWEALCYFKSQITNCCNPPCTVHNTNLHVLGSLLVFQISIHKLL